MISSTFDLFSKLGMEKTDFKANPDAPDGSLIPYIMQPSASSTNPWCFNNVTVWGSTYKDVQTAADTADPFNVDADKSISHEYAFLKYASCLITNTCFFSTGYSGPDLITS
jgi:hypothetical protein